jgi:hypothetical protein
MVATMDPPNGPAIIYEGPGDGAELMGADQANFYVPELDREFAVFVNAPLMMHVLSEVGLEDTRENREAVAQRLGGEIVGARIRYGILDPIAFVGLGVLDDYPDLLDRVRQPA